MKKEIIKSKISEEKVLAFDESKICAVAFAEMGAQMSDDGFIAVISNLRNCVSVVQGVLGFQSLGGMYNNYKEDVDIKIMDRTMPFLKWFYGVSMETTQRGNFAIDNEWVHLDALVGNHFFIRSRFVDEFLKRLNRRSICEVGIDIMTNMLSNSLEEQRNNGMIGAIVGDVAGSRFEWHNRKTKRFTLLRAKGESRHPCYFTDDTVMTLAVADAIMKWRENGGGAYDALSAETVMSMQNFGRRYPHAGYGGAFRRWLKDENPQPYNSWGNGSAMRVSACGWAGQTLDEVKALSRAVTEVTHNHPEGIKDAEATAVATFLARTGKSMEEIKEVVVRDYYPLDFTLDEIRPSYEFDVSCQGSVPPALVAFFESTSFEDAIRNAISIGGDSDTIAAITGAVAGAYYGVPEDIREKAERFLDPCLLETLHAFERGVGMSR